MEYPPELRARLVKIKMIISDVDGVLTDGSIFKGGDGVEFKRFSVEDGAGVAIARAAGLNIALISGRYSAATEARARELQIEDVYNGTLNKMLPYQALLEKYHLHDDEVAYIGDGIIDLAVMARSGVPISVQNAYPLVQEAAVHVTEKCGGSGAFREAVDWILKGQGRYETVLETLRQQLDQHTNT
ncbi:MAG: KdsC family phosphatase [Fidelibacterota bacterium]